MSEPTNVTRVWYTLWAIRMPLYSYTTAGSNVIRSSMLLSMVSVFSALAGAAVAAWVAASVGAAVAGAWVGADVACGWPGAAVAGAAVRAGGVHAVRITSAIEMKIIQGLRFDLYISSSSGKVVWDFCRLLNN